MECLDANVVQDLMAGALEPAARSRAVAHLDGCADCRDLIGALARDATRDAAFDTLRSDGDALASTRPPAPASTIDRAGRTLGRYAIGARVGAGAMGIVYRAQDKELGRDVALKLLHRPDAELTDRLVREARAMAQVNHPNVVAVYDVGVIDGITYIAMELVAGDSLRTWQQQAHTVPEIVGAYLAAGQGLAAAHDAGIVHRDFKPDNVLAGRDGRVRVTDFGLASSRPAEAAPRAASTTMSDVNLTTSGTVLGTPAYMAPEQFLGGHVDARTDQFNFCVALYEALYGARPFEGRAYEELEANVCEGRMRPAPPGSRISRGLRAILVRGLSVRPGDRFPSMEHLLLELGRDRAKPWRRTSRVATVLAAVLALGLVADLAVRDRVSDQIRIAFEATGRQTSRAFDRLADRLEATANQVYFLPAMRLVSGNRDQADFGLGTPEQDAQNLDRLHDELVSVTWDFARDVAGTQYRPVFAVADYKGRLMYSSAAPTRWRTDLTTLPWVKRALVGQGSSFVLVPTSDPALVASGVLGATPPTLAFVFARTLLLNGEAASQLMQIVDAEALLDDIRLDDTTRLSIVAPGGTSIGDVPASLLDERDGVREATLDGTLYQVQTKPLVRKDGEVIGHVAMARAMPRALSLFPGARVVFLTAMLAALVTALATALRARRITHARVAG